jgi:hypothetical protein
MAFTTIIPAAPSRLSIETIRDCHVEPGDRSGTRIREFPGMTPGVYAAQRGEYLNHIVLT